MAQAGQFVCRNLEAWQCSPSQHALMSASMHMHRQAEKAMRSLTADQSMHGSWQHQVSHQMVVYLLDTGLHSKDSQVKSPILCSWTSAGLWTGPVSARMLATCAEGHMPHLCCHVRQGPGRHDKAVCSQALNPKP